MLKSFINSAGNYHSTFIHIYIYCPQSPGSELRLRTPSPSNVTYLHKLSVPHKSRLIVTQNTHLRFHINPSTLTRIHTVNRIANKIVPLASKPITKVRQQSIRPRDITLPTGPRHTSEANQRAPRSTSCLRMSHTPHAHPRFPMATDMSRCHIVQARNNLM